MPWGVYLRVDNDRVDVMRAMIVGPQDTPYDLGLFVFDIYLPPNYPEEPPKVLFVTNGKGSFRFNPNLYSGQGKVCLSLLGTWSGPGWNPSQSTLLQVLISIQAMILNETPFLNEPGWECM
jgi:ubiquitin-protein ligase